jgi:hypothetical protein
MIAGKMFTNFKKAKNSKSRNPEANVITSSYNRIRPGAIGYPKCISIRLIRVLRACIEKTSIFSFER